MRFQFKQLFELIHNCSPDRMQTTEDEFVQAVMILTKTTV